MPKSSNSKLKTKPSNIGSTKNSKENLKPLTFNKLTKKSESKYKIVTGLQEFNVQRVNNMFIVRPCSKEELDTTTSDVSFNITKQDKIPNERKESHDSDNTNKQRVQSAKIKKDSQNNLPVVKKSRPHHQTSPRLIGKDNNCIFTKQSREFLNLVNQAIKLQKVFSIGNQNRISFPTVRNALKSRGWVEKCAAERLTEEDVINSKTAEVTIRLLKEAPINFIWVVHSLDFGTVKEDVIVSRFPKNHHFSTKVGLWRFMEDFHWFYEPNVSKTVTPKTFRVASKDDMDTFIKEFGLTACVSLLKIIVNQVATAESDSFFRNGMVPLSVFDFANAQCSEYISHRHHDDIDRKEDNEITIEEWKNFLSWYYKIAHEREHFETTSYPMIQALYTMSKMTLKNIEPYWPLLEIEGSRNLWVIKPPADFCGRGVRVMQNLQDIINHVQVLGENKYSRCIIQKYIERPLLIYNTKFDIRQWFLITSVYPLVIWIYKECYLRFSSQPFSLSDLHESVHLTNNAIQRNYTISNSRDPRLPQDNMWHCFKFQEYMREIGEPDKWNTVILPGIKKGIVGAVVASQDEMIERQNSFELYGADFLLGCDYTPILLEINMGPAMAPSTSVTAKLCKTGLEDVIKVVLDRRSDPKADTGKFELLYKQEMGPRFAHTGLDFAVYGSKLTPGKRTKKV